MQYSFLTRSVQPISILRRHHISKLSRYSTFGSVHISAPLSENLQIPNFMKIHPVGVELFHVDRDRQPDTQMDGRTNGRRKDRHDKASSRFSQFCERASKAAHSDHFPAWNSPVCHFTEGVECTRIVRDRNYIFNRFGYLEERDYIHRHKSNTAKTEWPV